MGLRRATKMGQKYSESLAELQRRQSAAVLLKHGPMLRFRVSGEVCQPSRC